MDKMMTGRLFRGKQLRDQMLTFIPLDPWKQILVECESKYEICQQENMFQNVDYEMADIISRSQCFMWVWVRLEMIGCIYISSTLNEFVLPALSQHLEIL